MVISYGQNERNLPVGNIGSGKTGRQEGGMQTPACLPTILCLGMRMLACLREDGDWGWGHGALTKGALRNPRKCEQVCFRKLEVFAYNPLCMR